MTEKILRKASSVFDLYLTTVNPQHEECHLYKRRWFILGIFFCFTMVVSLQWGQFVIIANLVVKYYEVDAKAVDLTTVLYMIAYLPLVFPALWLLDKIGVRKAMILSSTGVCIGTWIKFYASFSSDRYVFILIGQSFEAIFQVLAFGLAVRVCALWFGPHEISIACALAVFGDQFGTAVGFILPGMLVKNSEDKENIGNGFIRLNLTIAAFATTILIFVLIFFENGPKKPPSAAQVLQKISNIRTYSKDGNAVWIGIKEILNNYSFILMMISYGINMAVFNAFTTLLNDMILRFFPDYEHHIGIIGFIIMLLGIIGSLLGGHILDKTHLFKETTLLANGCSFLAMVLYTFALRSQCIMLVYVSAILLGFFMIGYYSVGIQLGIEITYPIPESTSASLLLLSVHVFGIIFTFLYRCAFAATGGLWPNLGISFLLLISTMITATIPLKLARQHAEEYNGNQSDLIIKSINA